MASTGEVWKLGHRPALDGVRGIAVLLVVFGHAFPAVLGGGGMVGVAVFFALSGFLITSLLLEEHAERGRVDVLAFYGRRARRLLPALFAFAAVLLVVGLVAPWLASPSYAWPTLVYLGNVPAVHNQWVGGFGHTWSLAVEEQFYIVFPMLLGLLLPRIGQRRLLWAVLAGVLASFGWREWLWAVAPGWNSDRIYFATDTNAGLLLVGCALALHMRLRAPRVARPGAASAVVVAIVALGFAADSLAARTLLPIVAALLAVGVIAAVVGSGNYAGVLTVPWLRLVGRRSYGLYLWHFPLLWIILPRLDGPRLLLAPALIGAAWCLTLLSWRYVERPFQRRRSDPAQHLERTDVLRRRAARGGSKPDVRRGQRLGAGGAVEPEHAVR